MNWWVFGAEVGDMKEDGMGDLGVNGRRGVEKVGLSGSAVRIDSG